MINSKAEFIRNSTSIFFITRLFPDSESQSRAETEEQQRQARKGLHCVCMNRQSKQNLDAIVGRNQDLFSSFEKGKKVKSLATGISGCELIVIYPRSWVDLFIYFNKVQ